MRLSDGEANADPQHGAYVLDLFGIELLLIVRNGFDGVNHLHLYPKPLLNSLDHFTNPGSPTAKGHAAYLDIRVG